MVILIFIFCKVDVLHTLPLNAHQKNQVCFSSIPKRNVEAVARPGEKGPEKAKGQKVYRARWNQSKTAPEGADQLSKVVL